jgi:hypothetical protein
VIRLLKLCIGLAAFLAFAWFGSTVKLGARTLFQHLRAIGETRESQELVDGTKQAAQPLVDGVRRRVTGAPAPPENAAGRRPDAGVPNEAISSSDRRQLRRLIGSAEHGKDKDRRATP